MKKFLTIAFIVILVIAFLLETALLITSIIQNVSPAVQWSMWMEALGFIKKPLETITIARFLL